MGQHRNVLKHGTQGKRKLIHVKADRETNRARKEKEIGRGKIAEKGRKIAKRREKREKKRKETEMRKAQKDS